MVFVVFVLQSNQVLYVFSWDSGFLYTIATNVIEYYVFWGFILVLS